MVEIYKETGRMIKDIDDSFINAILKKQFEYQHELKVRYNSNQIQKYIDDTKYHLSYLSEAITNNRQVLFNEYLAWIKIYFNGLPVTDDEIILNFLLVRDGLKEILPNEMSNISSKFINAGIEYYKSKPPLLPSFITDENPFKELAQNYLSFLVNGDKNSAHQLIMQSVENKTSIKDLYLNVFQVTQKETGRLWQLSRITVAQEHFITAATQLIMAQLYPYLFTTEQKNYKVIVSCVEGELHEIGARMVADIFEMEGWNSYYFGANTSIDNLIDNIKKHQPNIVAISATMIFNISTVSKIIQTIREFDSLNKIKILVGGYPFLIAKDLWKDIGADGFASDALAAVEIAERFLNQ